MSTALTQGSPLASIGLSQRDLLETRELPGGFCGVLLFFQQPRLVARSLHGLESPAPCLHTKGTRLGRALWLELSLHPTGDTPSVGTATVTVHPPNPPPMRGPCAGDRPHPSSSPPNTPWGLPPSQGHFRPPPQPVTPQSHQPRPNLQSCPGGDWAPVAPLLSSASGQMLPAPMCQKLLEALLECGRSM